MRFAPADLHGLPDVEGKVGRRHETEPDLAGVQRDMHVARQKLHDLHVLGIVAPRDLVVLGLHEVERDEAVVGSARTSAAANAVCVNTSSIGVLRLTWTM